jgi:SNF2 family DNA or RNA helicase
MLSLKNLTPDQNECVTHLFEHDSTLLVADMGAGKTVCAMTAAAELLASKFVNKILVITTIKVAQNVWATEHQKWSHLTHLKVAMALGSEQDREVGLAAKADLICINFENLRWLCETLGNDLVKKFDGLIIDEVSKLKSNSGSNFKAIKKYIRKFKWRLTMTGTPVSEDWTGLFGQIYMTDGGKALGKNKQKYLENYFYPTDFQQRNWSLLPDQDARILTKIKPLLYHLPDYRHELPDLIEQDIIIDMPSHSKKLYSQFKKTMVADFNNSEIAAQNSAALTGKLQQICQGFMYGENTIFEMENPKLDKLKNLVAENSKPKIIVYWFKQDLKNLQKVFPDGVVLKNPSDVDAWNRGKINLLFLQPRSAAHGLNLASGGHQIIFYSMVWSNDLYLQTIARLWRRGAKNSVTVKKLIMENTIDEIINLRLSDKKKYQTLLLSHIAM